MLDLLDSFSTGTLITKKLVRRKGDELKTLALRQREKYESDIEHLRASVLRKVQRLEDRLSSTEIISTGEKLTFSFGLLNVFYAGFLMGSYPEYFHVFYTIELMVLLPIRFYSYKRKQYHYFLADLCYFVNMLNLIYIWLFPESAHLFISCYALSFGTLSWAVITWRNSLVLHSIDKTTSSFIHILPPTVFHVITHKLDPVFKAARFPGAQRFDQWQTFTGILSASLAYLVWQSLYHYFITLKRQEKIKAGRATSFEFLRKSYAKTPLGKFVNGLPEPFPVVAFTLIQYSYQLGTMSLCPIWYSHSVLSALFVTFIFFWASLNGATYYIDIFGKRFQKQLLELQAEVADWKDKDEAKHAKSENDNNVKNDKDAKEAKQEVSDAKRTKQEEVPEHNAKN
ncbi:hypothetical protein D0Z00_000643 [Geotrichum galactomycetum]|uniref:Uncharacterized protein n=1 Tax=Geotrichum galactomycetum TaxID=27317 RepID=A0ACB6V922_9ASCO|nr:hypothetical protein D0Z00_000643 [Geotrichum candidum]